MANATARKIRQLFEHKSEIEGEGRIAAESAVALKNGPAAAAILASGIGVALFGAAVFLAETFTAVKEIFKLYAPVGPLSGKTTVGVALWLIAWGVLHFLWREKEVRFGKVMVLTAIAMVIGLVLTFPPVFTLFAAE